MKGSFDETLEHTPTRCNFVSIRRILRWTGSAASLCSDSTRDNGLSLGRRRWSHSRYSHSPRFNKRHSFCGLKDLESQATNQSAIGVAIILVISSSRLLIRERMTGCPGFQPRRTGRSASGNPRTRHCCCGSEICASMRAIRGSTSACRFLSSFVIRFMAVAFTRMIVGSSYPRGTYPSQSELH